MDITVALLGLVSIDYSATLDTLISVCVTDLIAQPGLLTTPVNGLISLPCIGTATSKTKCGQAHGLNGDITSEEEEIGPGDLVTVLLLNGPEEAASLVEGNVIRPAVEGSKSLLTLSTTSTAVEDTVGTGTVPCLEKSVLVLKLFGGR